VVPLKRTRQIEIEWPDSTGVFVRHLKRIPSFNGQQVRGYYSRLPTAQKQVVSRAGSHAMLPRRASDGVARSVCRVKQKRIRKAFFRLSTTNVIKLRYLRYDIIYETVLLLLAHFKKRIEPSASLSDLDVRQVSSCVFGRNISRSLFAGGIDGGRRLWFLATLVLTLTTAVAAVEEAPASRRHAYAAMMYMGTPRDYEFYVATRVMMRSLAKLNVDADLVVIASVDVPARWVQTL
ncbi:hypothetical protein BHE74_00026877, partial [Ensete ventricosum]